MAAARLSAVLDAGGDTTRRRIERPAGAAGTGGSQPTGVSRGGRAGGSESRWEIEGRSERGRAGGRDPFGEDLVVMGGPGLGPVRRRFRSSAGGCYSGTRRKKRAKDFAVAVVRVQRGRGQVRHSSHSDRGVTDGRNLRRRLGQVNPPSPRSCPFPRGTTAGFISASGGWVRFGKVAATGIVRRGRVSKVPPRIETLRARTGGGRVTQKPRLGRGLDALIAGPAERRPARRPSSPSTGFKLTPTSPAKRSTTTSSPS